MISNDKAALLLHGWPGASDDFHLVRQSLPAIIRTIAPDLAGYGRSF